MRLDEVEKENSELSAECDILAAQVNEEKAKVMHIIEGAAIW